MAKKRTPKKSEQLAPVTQGDMEHQSQSLKSDTADFGSRGNAGASKANVFDEGDVDAVKAIVSFLSENTQSHHIGEEELTSGETVNSATCETNDIGDTSNTSNTDNAKDETDYFNSVEFKTKQFDFIDELEELEQRENESSEMVSNDDNESNEMASNNDNNEAVSDNVGESKLLKVEGALESEEELFSESMDSIPVDNLEESTFDGSELEGSELEGFESAAIEELEFIEEARLESIVESVLFATDRPVSIPTLKQVFKGTNVTNARLKKALDTLQVEYAGGRRGVTLEEVGSGYQLRTKVDNMEFLRRSFKAKSFKLSGPALEVLAITAYKQPVVKAEIDEIRGVESGHLLRALMEKNLVLFAGKSDLPGKPMQYATTRKFLEIFGLRNLKELPTLSQIDELLPEGIGDEEEKPKLADITEGLSEKVGQSYSEGEEELTKISDQLEKIDTSSEFFEKEKLRQKQEKDAEKARNIQEAMAVGEEVPTRDRNWLKRYEEQLAAVVAAGKGLTEDGVGGADESDALGLAMESWDQENDGSNFSSSSSETEISEEEISEADEESELLAQRYEDNDIASIDEEV